jgi:hypothetical protein
MEPSQTGCFTSLGSNRRNATRGIQRCVFQSQRTLRSKVMGAGRRPAALAAPPTFDRRRSTLTGSCSQRPDASRSQRCGRHGQRMLRSTAVDLCVFCQAQGLPLTGKRQLRVPVDAAHRAGSNGARFRVNGAAGRRQTAGQPKARVEASGAALSNLLRPKVAFGRIRHGLAPGLEISRAPPTGKAAMTCAAACPRERTCAPAQVTQWVGAARWTLAPAFARRGPAYYSSFWPRLSRGTWAATRWSGTCAFCSAAPSCMHARQVP